MVMINRISIALLTLVILSGCKSKEPGALPPPEGDLVHLLSADPAAVTTAQLLARAQAADEWAAKYHVVDGIFWQARRSTDFAAPPDSYGSGGDSLLFTGMYVGATSFRYAVTRDSADLDKAIDSLRGLYILTHASGTPGALMRCAFPTGEGAKWGYPDSWGSRIARGFVYDSPTDLDDPFNPGQKLPQYTYYTRVTRDQITGLVYGLSAFWEVVTPDLTADPAEKAKINQARQILAQIVEDVYRKLRADDWKIRDHTGRNDTNSDSVKQDLLRLTLLGVYRKTAALTSGADRAARIQGKYEDLLDAIKVLGFFPSDPFNRFSSGFQYYAWNLRLTRASALWLTADAGDKDLVAGYIRKWMFRHVKNHKNAWFSLIHAVASGDAEAGADAVLSLKSWSLRPTVGWPSPLAKGWGRDYVRPNEAARISGLADDKVLWPHLRKPTGYWTWQKGPWDNGVTYPIPDLETGTLDTLLPYWMARYYGLIQ